MWFVDGQVVPRHGEGRGIPRRMIGEKPPGALVLPTAEAKMERVSASPSIMVILVVGQWAWTTLFSWTGTTGVSRQVLAPVAVQFVVQITIWHSIAILSGQVYSDSGRWEVRWTRTKADVRRARRRRGGRGTGRPVGPEDCKREEMGRGGGS